MSFAIFSDITKAEEYISRINAKLGYPKAGIPAAEYPYGWTTSYATPRRHPAGRKWAVPVLEGVVPVATVVETLGDDWVEPLT